MKRVACATRYVLISQGSLYGFLIISIVLMPNFLLQNNEGGLSNYGVYELTIIPYSLAFLLGGVFLYLAGKELPVYIPHRKLLSSMLTCICFLLLLVLLTTYPYQINAEFDELHIATAVALSLVELAASVWLSLSLARSRVSIVLLGVGVIGFTLLALTFAGVLHVLSLAQIILGIAFGLLLTRTVSYVILASEHTDYLSKTGR